MIKSLTSNKNSAHFNELEHFKHQTTKLQHVLTINRLFSICEDANIVILTVVIVILIVIKYNSQ